MSLFNEFIDDDFNRNPRWSGTLYNDEEFLFNDDGGSASPCEAEDPPLSSGPLESGIRIIDSVEDFLCTLSSYCGVKVDDSLLKEVEGLMALYITILGCKDTLSMSSAIFLYVRSHFGKSITKEVTSYIKEALFPFVAQSSGGPTWLGLLKAARYDWAVCKGNKLFDHFSKLLGLLVTLGLCRASNVTFSLREFKLCEPDMSILHGSATDVIDAVFSTVSFFVEGLYLCFKQRSLKPLWSNSSISLELDEEYSLIIGWWELVKNGNLERVTKESGEEVKVTEFDRRLEGLCSKLRNLISTMKGFEKKLVADKYQKLLQVKNDYITKRISSGIRKAPFAIELFGASSQGKSTFGDQLVDALLLSCNAPLGKEYRASFNPGDEYMSNWTTDKLVLLFDDVSNEKSNFVQRPPTRAIIDVCNNEPYYANKAELEAKGKVFVEPLIAVVTTNIKNLDSYVYSNCPYSVQRRMDVVITVEAKCEFQKTVDGKTQGVDSSKIRMAYTKDGVYNPPAFDDIWVLTVERAIQPSRLDEAASYAPIFWEERGVLLKNVSMKLVMQYVIEQYHIHELNQQALIDSMLTRESKMERCPHLNCRQVKGFCDAHDNVPHFGEEIVQAINFAKTTITTKLRSDFGVYGSMAEKAATIAIVGAATQFAYRWDWMSIIPTSVAESPMFLGVMTLAKFYELRRKYYLQSLLLWLCFFSFIPFIWLHDWRIFNYVTLEYLYGYKVLCTVFIIMGFPLAQRRLYDDIIRLYRRFLLNRNCINPLWQSTRDRHISTVCGACGILGVLYAMAKVYKRYKSIVPQGSLEPITSDEVKERDSEVSPWTTVTPRELPISLVSKTVTCDVLSKLAEKNLVYATLVTRGGRKLMANGLFLRSNVVLIPSHYFESEELEATFRKIRPDSCGGKFAARLSLEASYHIPGTDLLMCYCSTGGSFRDLTKHFPMDHMPKHPFQMVYRRKSGDIISAKGIADPMIVSTRTKDDEYTYVGGVYHNLTIDTFLGLCGAVLVSSTPGSVISGIHLGGATGTPRGCYGSVTTSDLSDGYDYLRCVEGVLLTGTAEQFDTQVFGIEMVKMGAEPHKKSSLNYMPINSQLEYYGACGGQMSSHTAVRVTPISEHIVDVFAKPNIWGPPKMKPEWFGWQKCMENISVPALPYSHDLLALAIRDYKSAVEPIFTNGIWCKTAPLCDMDNVNGIPGQKFMDAIKSNTAIGYPLTGIKAKHMVELTPTARHPHKKTFTQEIWDHISRVEDKYRRGERAFEVAKAQKKDEVLNMSKDKCRIFYGNSLALTFLIRKYYLPIIRVLQMNPLVSECAVGINCHGPEWEDLHNHVLKYGSDRLFGGDYGKYDQKLPSQLILASFRILIDFAKLCEYKQIDIDIMEAMAGDVVYALIAFNGDLIGLTEGTHISGNSLTVDINGIAGSLNCRCFFYELFPCNDFDSRVPFREAVSLITYGDDNIGSVQEGYEDFNIKSFSEFLGTYGQIYTMPSKDSELKKYLDFHEFEFLKRKSVYHNVLGVHLGALDDSSIFKSLHCYMREKKSPLTPEMACAINITTAAREWFNHGERVYDLRCSQLREVANRANIAHMCEGLDLTYMDRVNDWRQRYEFKTVKGFEPMIFDLE